MKKIVLLSLLLTAMSASAGGLLFKDYSVGDDYMKPLSIGAASWTCDDYGTQAGAYFSAAFFGYKDVLRMELGVVAIMDEGTLRPRAMTGISTPVFDNFVVGAYYAPFWGLDPRNEDPFGVMVGFRF